MQKTEVEGKICNLEWRTRNWVQRSIPRWICSDVVLLRRRNIILGKLTFPSRISGIALIYVLQEEAINTLNSTSSAYERFIVCFTSTDMKFLDLRHVS